VVNTGDDHIHAGLLVSPDVDSVTYALSGHFDEERGWGRLEDTFACADELAKYGHGWFRVGDADLALSLERTLRADRGESKVSLTAAICAALGVRATVLPMTEASVPTKVVVGDGTKLLLQEYLVRDRARPSVDRIEIGSSGAPPASGVAEAIVSADLVVFAPSNPISSIGPILELAGLRNLLRDRQRPTVAISAVVCSRPPLTLAERTRYHVREVFLKSAGTTHTPEGVAELYHGLIDGFVVDARDAAHLGVVEEYVGQATMADTLSSSEIERKQLWEQVIEFGMALA
jgi:LPPG:FO 2-phospho-L-lactate transferase